jgi:hypothetical protein
VGGVRQERAAFMLQCIRKAGFTPDCCGALAHGFISLAKVDARR